jgi:hypothetical protein
MTSIPLFPLRVSANHRHLVDANNLPTLIHGDTAWSIITALNAVEIERYLANRAAKGFNAIIVNLIEHKFNGPLNRAGEHPFNDPKDLSTPNERYFAFADWVIQRAAEHGMVVFLAPLYLGYKHAADDDGWYHEARLSGANKCWQYGRFLGNRYAGYNNILWMIGGDRNPDGVVDEITSLIAGIKEFDSRNLFTAHAHPDDPTPAKYGFGSWLDLNGTYTYQIVHKKLLADANHQPILPFVLMETTYEGEHNASALQIRRQAYYAILCGACGQFLGNNPIWLFNPGWEQALDGQGSRDMVHLKSFFSAHPWVDLIPDQKHSVVTGGLGEFNGMDYLAAAVTPHDKTLLAYLPTPRLVTVDLTRLAAGHVSVTWFDPRSGVSQSGGKFPTTGSVELTPPGEGDWGLVITSTPD